MTISFDGLKFARLFVIAAFAVLLPLAASAQSLDALRAEGVVGERYDGTAVVRAPNAPGDVRAFVDRVNVQRQKIYADRAAQQNVPAGQVGRIYAKQIFDKLPAGAWFLDEAGGWRQK